LAVFSWAELAVNHKVTALGCSELDDLQPFFIGHY
jgi:hypothetical protein